MNLTFEGTYDEGYDEGYESALDEVACWVLDMLEDPDTPEAGRKVPRRLLVVLGVELEV